MIFVFGFQSCDSDNIPAGTQTIEQMCCDWLYFFRNCYFENVISTVTEYNLVNFIFWSFVSWISAKSFINVAVPSHLKVFGQFCTSVRNLVIYVAENIRKKKNDKKTAILKQNSLGNSINVFPTFLTKSDFAWPFFNCTNWGLRYKVKLQQ